MKKLPVQQILYQSPQEILYRTDEDVYVRDVVVDAGIGKEVYIGFMSDIHFNYCNKQDMEEADPVVMSTLEYRKWLADGYTVPIARRCYALMDDADQIVLGGDTLDYLSHGCMELMEQEVWTPHPDTIAVLGGHERARQMQGKVPENTSMEERLAVLAAWWRHDIYYVSRLVGGKVLVIGLFNDLGQYYAPQKDRLAADLALARENGYTVLVFAHEPIATGNPAYRCLTKEMSMLPGDPTVFGRDLCDGSASGSRIAGGALSDPLTKEIHEMITGSADVVKAIVTGHYHSAFTFENLCHTPDGTEVIVPQYVNTATAYGAGCVIRILVK